MAHWSQVVVGVDGSEGSQRALVWAAAEAREHQAVLHLVASWAAPLPPVGAGYSAYPWTGSADLQDYTKRMLARSVEEALGEESGPPITQEVLQGHAAQILIEASKDADLVVVGCRGRGGFAGMLLGSVSQQVAAHAHCPVAVIR